MSNQRFNGLHLALVSLLGAVILEIIVIVSTGLSKAFTVEQVPSHLAALLVGGLGGWVFEIFRQMTTVTGEAIQNVATLETSVAALTAKITYQDAALGMLIQCPRHNAALTMLIQTSMSDNFRNIPLIGIPRYLGFLKTAIEHSDGYQGVQRRPLRWFKETGAGSYLVDLRRRDMTFKQRVFIIDDSDEEHMRQDLTDRAVVEYYWRNTGRVQSYWLTVSEFKKSFPGWRVPRDLALYDHQLLISYDENNQLLSFDVVDGDADEPKLFDSIQEMARHGVGVLKEIEEV